MMKAPLLATTLLGSLMIGHLQAQVLVNDWKLITGNTTATTAGMNTSSPTIGDGTGQDADDARLVGLFGSYTLDVGDNIELTGSVVFSAGTGGEFGNVRFGLWNDNGQFATAEATNWDGFLVTSGSSLQEKTDGNFVSDNGTGIGSQTANTGTFTNNSTAAYNFSISITRDSATTLDINTSLTGGDNGIMNTFAALDRTTDKFTFTSAGFLLGGNLNLSQADFSDVQVSGSVVPEPSAFALLAGCFGLTWVMLRRRSA